MADRKYYVICDSGCKFESMTKEQILTAITQAVNEGTVGDIDAGFITKIQEMNSRGQLQFWVGTTAQYNALKAKDDSTLYILTDESADKMFEAIEAEIAVIEAEVAAIKERVATAEEIAAIKADIAAIEVELGYIGGEVSTIKSDDLYRLGLSIASIREELTTLNNEVENDCLKKSGGTINGNLTVVGALNATATRAHNATKAESATEADHATRADNADNADIADSAKKLAGCMSAEYDARADAFIINEFGVYLLVGRLHGGTLEYFVSGIIAIPSLITPAFGASVGEFNCVPTYENTEFGYRLRFYIEGQTSDVYLDYYNAYKIMDLAQEIDA